MAFNQYSHLLECVRMLHEHRKRGIIYPIRDLMFLDDFLTAHKSQNQREYRLHPHKGEESLYPVQFIDGIRYVITLSLINPTELCYQRLLTECIFSIKNYRSDTS